MINEFKKKKKKLDEIDIKNFRKVRCPDCESVFENDTIALNNNVCTKCGYHFSMTPEMRINLICDPNTFEVININIGEPNPINFPDYLEKKKDIMRKTNTKEAAVAGFGNINNTGAGTPPDFLTTKTSGSAVNTSGSNSMTNYSSNISGSLGLVGSCGLDSLKSLSDDFTPKNTLKRKLVRSAKTIETGRVEVGSDSSQTFKYVNKKFEWFPFHTIEYKLLPTSQKINTVDDLNVKVYCVNCGHKLAKTDKFCGQCGTKK